MRGAIFINIAQCDLDVNTAHVDIDCTLNVCDASFPTFDLLKS